MSSSPQQIIVSNTSQREVSEERVFYLDLLSKTNLDLSKIQTEKLAYQLQRKKLLQDSSLIGKYVAFHNEKLVDSDFDFVVLAKKMHDKYGNSPILIERLGNELKAKVRSPKEVR